MSVLEWILLLEVIVVVIATLFWGVALFIARNYPDDPIYIFTKTFWMTFLYPSPEVVREPGFDVRASGSDDAGAPKSTSGRGGLGSAKRKGPQHDEEAAASEEDAFYGRVKAGDDGVVHTANLNVVVLPHSEKDEVLGRTSDGIELQVTAAAEDGASNKAVIQLVSKALGVKPYQVTLTKGHYQTRKAVAVTGMDQGQLEAKLDEMG
ncbi:MAG: DUF167 domain-containing protein [Tepidisphaeraceae bacterium]